MHRLRSFNRILIAVAALTLGSLLKVAIWRIDLSAPQYPEGLYLQIFHDRFDGDVNKINGLNHYIGMATIHNEMFPEFAIMRYVFYGLVAWGLLAAVIGYRGVLFSWLFGLFAFVIWAMWDMYSWGYNYGHDLDPHAAIKVEGMAYQPPLIGHKKLLNFDAWSLPDTGAWILFAVIAIVCLVWFVEWKWPRGSIFPDRTKHAPGITAPMTAATALLLLLSFNGCGHQGPPTIDYGKTECSFCRMNVMDRQFAAAITTVKGRTYAFDSPECMVGHVAAGNIAEDQVQGWWVSDHAHPGTLMDATKAFYLHADALHSPMNGNTAAFATSDERAMALKSTPGEALDWSGARTSLSDK